MTKKETTHCSDEHCREEQCEAEQNSPSPHQCKGKCKERSEHSCKEEHTEAHSYEGTCEEDASDCTEETPLKELTKTLKFLQADFENYRKRVERDNADFKKYATKQLLVEIIPVLDNFGHALKTVDDEGVRLIHMQLMGILEKYGLKEIECLGKKFDPKLHEALLQEESDKEANIVLDVLQKGYIVGDAVLRPARVKITRKKQDETARVPTGGTS